MWSQCVWAHFVNGFLQNMLTVTRLIQECWAKAPAARLTSLRVKKTLGKIKSNVRNGMTKLWRTKWPRRKMWARNSDCFWADGCSFFNAFCGALLRTEREQRSAHLGSALHRVVGAESEEHRNCCYSLNDVLLGSVESCSCYCLFDSFWVATVSFAKSVPSCTCGLMIGCRAIQNR